MKFLQIFFLSLCFVPCLCRAADEGNIEDYGSLMEDGDHIHESNDDRAQRLLDNLSLRWMIENHYLDYQTAKLFVATSIEVPGRDYPYLYTRQALQAGANPYSILDVNNRSPFIIAVEQSRPDIYNLLLIMSKKKKTDY